MTTYLLIMTLWFTGAPDDPITYRVTEIPSREACLTLEARLRANMRPYTTKVWSECAKEETA